MKILNTAGDFQVFNDGGSEMEIFNDELLDMDEDELQDLAESDDLDDDLRAEVEDLLENL